MRTIAPRQDTIHTMSEAYEEGQESQGEMIRRAAHKRGCHMGGHRVTVRCADCKRACVAHPREIAAPGRLPVVIHPRTYDCACEVPKRPTCIKCKVKPCSTCKPHTCPECKDGASTAWDRQRWSLEREANAWLAGERSAAPAIDVHALRGLMILVSILGT